MLKVGLVGLPNVGKSTLFNALARAEARVSSYPFTTIDSNVGVAVVPDPRLARLEALLDPLDTTPCAIEFIDIAGLVEGASRGEGLGNRFLGSIRTVDLIAHVVRLFDQPDVAHGYPGLDPVRDAEIVQTELLLADLEVLGRAIEKRSKVWATDPGAHAGERELLERCRTRLEEGRPLASLELDAAARVELEAVGMLTTKPVVWVANLSESEVGPQEPPAVEELGRALGEEGRPAEVVALSALLEAELAALEEDDRREMLEMLSLPASGLERLVERCFDRLGLIRFYTVANRKLRAWELPRGVAAPAAAGRIHSDMESGFIRARVASFDELVAAGGLAELAHQGRLRTEGKEYQIRDGDVVEFLFSR